jgi:transposase
LVLGPALSRKAIPGGKATHDTIAAQQIAVLLRGGMLPQAYVYPAERRATRDWLRRRFHLPRQRAELLTPVQPTTWPYNLPEIGKQLAYTANRDGVAARVPEPAVQKRGDVDRALMAYEAPLRSAVEVPSVQTATPHHAQPRSRLHSVPGLGKILRWVLREERHDRTRFPRLQEVVSSGRRVKGAQESAGTRDGTSGAKSGTTSLKGAFADAAVLCLRNNPAAQQDRARLAPKPGQGHALTVCAHQ